MSLKGNMTKMESKASQAGLQVWPRDVPAGLSSCLSPLPPSIAVEDALVQPARPTPDNCDLPQAVCLLPVRLLDPLEPDGPSPSKEALARKSGPTTDECRVVPGRLWMPSVGRSAGYSTAPKTSANSAMRTRTPWEASTQ